MSARRRSWKPRWFSSRVSASVAARLDSRALWAWIRARTPTVAPTPVTARALRSHAWAPCSTATTTSSQRSPQATVAGPSARERARVSSSRCPMLPAPIFQGRPCPRGSHRSLRRTA
jgi:hypothetical protein